MFEVSTSWLNGAGQVLVYALVISAGPIVMRLRSGERKDNE